MSSAGADPSSATPASSFAAAGAAAAAVAAAAAGAGPSSAAPASSAAASAAGVSAGSVFVKRAEDVDAAFAEVDIYAGDNVARLADRACAKFRWLVGADKVKLFLVPDDLVRDIQLMPEHEAGVFVRENLRLATDALAEAGIRDRSCLLARLLDPPAAAPGECARAACSLLSCSPSRGAGVARGTARDSAVVFVGRSPFPSSLPFAGGGGGGSNAAAASGGFGGGFSGGGGGGGGGGAMAVGGGGGGFLSEAARAEMREVAFAAARAVADEIVASRRSSATSLSSTRALAPGFTAEHLRDAMLAANRGPALIALGAGGQAGAAAGASGAAAAEPGELEADSANNSSSSDNSKAPEFPSDVEGDVRDPQPKPGTGGGGGGGGSSGGSGGGSGDGGVGNGASTLKSSCQPSYRSGSGDWHTPRAVTPF